MNKKSFLVSLFTAIVIIGLSGAEKHTIQLDLEKAIFFAISNNKDLKISKATINIQNKAFYYELRKFLPTLTMGFSFNDSVAFDAPDSHSTGLTLGANMLVFDGGKIIFDYMSKKVELEFSKKELLVKTNKLIQDTRNSYQSLLQIIEKEKIQAELLRIALIQEKHADLELETGAITEIDYYDIKLRVKQIEIDIEKLKRERDNAFDGFKYFLGLEQQEIVLEEEKTYEFISLSENDIQFLQNVALSNRLDLSQSYYSVMKSKVNYWYTVLGFIPEITSSVQLNLSGEEFPPRDKSWSVNFDIKIPLAYLPMDTSVGFGGEGQNIKRSKSNSTSSKVGQNITYENDIAQSKIALSSEAIKYEELLRKIKLEVKNSVENYMESVKVFKLKQEQNEFALKKLNIMRLKLELGEIKRIDLLEEEMNYNKELIVEKNMLYELKNSEIAIQGAIGNYNTDLGDLLKNYRRMKGTLHDSQRNEE